MACRLVVCDDAGLGSAEYSGATPAPIACVTKVFDYGTKAAVARLVRPNTVAILSGYDNQHPYRAAPALLQTGLTGATNALFWLTLSLIGAAGSYSDTLRSHGDVGFLRLFESWCRGYVPDCLFGIVLQLINRRWPTVSSARNAW